MQELPSDLREDVEVVLREGVHRSRPQLFAHHKGYKLVVEQPPRSRFHPQSGELWVLRPNHSPNGHIVFCMPVRMRACRDGIHPIVKTTRRYVEGGLTVSIRNESGTTKGALRSVAVEGGILLISIEGAKRCSRNEILARPIGNVVLRFAEEDILGEKSLPYGRFGLRCMKDGRSVDVTFWESLHD